jgi:hypothetical protein
MFLYTILTFIFILRSKLFLIISGSSGRSGQPDTSSVQ